AALQLAVLELVHDPAGNSLLSGRLCHGCSSSFLNSNRAEPAGFLSMNGHVRPNRNDPQVLGLRTSQILLEAAMKRFAIAVAATVLLVQSPAFAQSAGEKTGINSALDISPTTADFVKEAATSDMLEIAAAKI